MRAPRRSCTYQANRLKSPKATQALDQISDPILRVFVHTPFQVAGNIKWFFSTLLTVGLLIQSIQPKEFARSCSGSPPAQELKELCTPPLVLARRMTGQGWASGLRQE